MGELVDLVNDYGQIVERSVPREAVGDYPDLRMQVVTVVVRYSGLIVWQQRHPDKPHGLEIDHVCGAVDSGIEPADVARREVMEEVGIGLVTLDLVTSGINEFGKYRYLYAATTDQNPKFDPSLGGVVDAGVASVDKLTHWQQTGIIFVNGFFKNIQKTA